MKINARGFWENNSVEGHGHDQGLATALEEFLLDQGHALDVIDVGCGDGYYTRRLLERGINCIGYDGNPHTETITNGLCHVADFSIPQRKLGIFDWVLSLEVGEHIPKEFERNFIENIDWLGVSGVIISWAVPGQGGDGHINCKTNAEVDNIFYDLGFWKNYEAQEKLRNSCATYPTPCYWFRNTLLVYGK